VSEPIIPIVRICFVVCAHGVSKKFEYMFGDGAGYQLTELSGQAGFGWRERGGYCRLDAGVEIETRLVEDPWRGREESLGIMWG
jgi:hypothetical protein